MWSTFAITVWVQKGKVVFSLLLTTADAWYLAPDAKHLTAVVFLDLSKAFDNVRHDLLLLSLQNFWIGWNCPRPRVVLQLP